MTARLRRALEMLAAADPAELAFEVRSGNISRHELEEARASVARLIRSIPPRRRARRTGRCLSVREAEALVSGRKPRPDQSNRKGR